MERFSLEEWLKDKSRKLVTRDGRPVRIICWDIDSDTPILVAFRLRQDREEVFAYGTDGKSIVNPDYDLFFADEEEGLTGFEDKLLAFALMFGANLEEEKIEYVKECSKTLLGLAREEICLTCKEYSRGYQEGLKLGREDALKDLPKWKKCIGSTGPFIDDFRGEDYLYLKDYVVKVSELFEKLPKGE